MAVYRVEKNKDFTVMSNHHLRNKNLSLKVRGLLGTMLSNKDDWVYSLSHLADQCKEGISAVRSGLVELEEAGYVVRKQRRDKNGKFVDVEYIIYENPILENPISENRISDKSISENETVINTIERNTKESGVVVSLTSEVIPEDERLFLEFWEAYPKKVDRKGSFRAFKNIPKLKEVFPGIMSALEIQKRSEQWTKQNGQFIPNPTTYIHQERWTTVRESDELQTRIDDIVKQNIDGFLV